MSLKLKYRLKKHFKSEKQLNRQQVKVKSKSNFVYCRR